MPEIENQHEMPHDSGDVPYQPDATMDPFWGVVGAIVLLAAAAIRWIWKR